VENALGRNRIKAFWLAGHSQGGMTSNRIVCTDFFKNRIDGWLSLSGGRIGPAQLSPNFGVPGGAPRPPPASGSGPRPGAAQTPDCDMNYIFETGELEIGPLPSTSPWAERYKCGPRVKTKQIIDSRAGWVYDTGRQNPGNPAWGLAARPGKADVMVYPKCRGGRLVADVVRYDKGHTEGLEPKVTEELIKMIVQSKPVNSKKS
jgi:hypothetical protein